MGLRVEEEGAMVDGLDVEGLRVGENEGDSVGISVGTEVVGTSVGDWVEEVGKAVVGLAVEGLDVVGDLLKEGAKLTVGAMVG